ncbi:DUF2125 domain-containing protein [Cognatiyoonia sp. IB215446]|uniref:DUF2125 domain-containing protein n=1 Tax=Cognatiyoonia sp. IB215446 TaxID=3097355 RepID=UPI002A119154|nr:DUF2125 domain-containing protein [Cognatiyoonia sp. IB215446]MDX8349908.1 DUF2125 domain-containing protein [Cognatiyoonia sp. IB215446]
MARLIIWTLILVLLYGGYWFGVTRTLDQVIRNGLTQARAQGWQVEFETLETSGFPGDFDLKGSDIDIVAAGNVWAWQAPNLRLSAPSLQPTRLAAELPNTQTLHLGDQSFQIESDVLELTAATQFNMALQFDAAHITAKETRIRADAGWQAGLDNAIGAVTATPNQDRTYDLDVTASGITFPISVVQQVDPTGTLANVVDQLALDAAVTLDRTLDRHAFADPNDQPVLERIVLHQFDMRWGDIGLQASGAFDVDATGAPDGRITFRTAEWQTIIDLCVAMGAIDRGVAPTLSNMARGMVNADGVLVVPINFSDGFMSMGLLPLGPAPRFH